MPRRPNAGLESAILKSALHLLDSAGLDSVTMREVAKGAKTTTPTVYERFADREALVWRVVNVVTLDIYQRVEHAKSIKDLIEGIDSYLDEHPNRVELVNRYWPVIMSTSRPKPVFELACKLLMETRGCDRRTAAEMAMSLAALLVGTIMLRRSAGNSKVAKDLTASRVKAVNAICRCWKT